MAGIRLAIPLRLITVRREHRLQALHPGLSALLFGIDRIEVRVNDRDLQGMPHAVSR